MASLLRRPPRSTPDGRTWQFIDFDVRHLTARQSLQGESRGNEMALIVLAGTACVDVGEQRFERVGGRRDVWERVPPSFVLMPPGCRYAVWAETDAEVVIAAAGARDTRRSPRLIRAADILIEQRGEGQTLRQVHHLLPPSAAAERLIVVEVYTPAGNWSSFPPHKHDTDDPPRESSLEETYYFHVDPPSGYALQRVYATDGTLDECLAPRDGDLVLVPRGYHVVAATPGHACYYLNVMAGLGRAWNFTLDPAYATLLNWQKPPGT